MINLIYFRQEIVDDEEEKNIFDNIPEDICEEPQHIAGNDNSHMFGQQQNRFLPSGQEIMNKKKRETIAKQKQARANARIEKKKKKLAKKLNKKNRLTMQEKDDLFLCLHEYYQVLIPEINQCKIQLNLARRMKDMNAFNHWNTELEKLNTAYKLFQQQSIEIKKEANESDMNTIDLHAMIRDEAMVALHSKIEEKVRITLIYIFS